MIDKKIYQALAEICEEELYIEAVNRHRLTGMIVIPEDPFVGEPGLTCIDLFCGTSYRPNRVVKVMYREEEELSVLKDRMLRSIQWLLDPLLVPNDS